MKLYETLAADIASQIAQGVIREGEKIPSVRQTSQHHNLVLTPQASSVDNGRLLMAWVEKYIDLVGWATTKPMPIK